MIIQMDRILAPCGRRAAPQSRRVADAVEPVQNEAGSPGRQKSDAYARTTARPPAIGAPASPSGGRLRDAHRCAGHAARGRRL